jgi:hypothetical protein
VLALPTKGTIESFFAISFFRHNRTRPGFFSLYPNLDLFSKTLNGFFVFSSGFVNIAAVADGNDDDGDIFVLNATNNPIIPDAITP